MYYYSNELAHYGLKGMKWGQRRWQYDDGRFNDAGKARYFGQNSTHRPDSVRVLQGDKPKASSGSQSGSFDRDRAKKIAKNVAIGAAVVGGTVLVAYGGYKIHQMGGIQKVSQDLTAKMRETKLQNLKASEQFKTDKAQIKLDAKQDRLNRREELKTNILKAKEDAKTQRENILNNAKLERQMNDFDPEGKIDRDILKKELLKENAAKESMRMKGAEGGLQGKQIARNYAKTVDQRTKAQIANLSPSDVERLNSGKATLKDLNRERYMENNLAKTTTITPSNATVRKIASNANTRTISSNANSGKTKTAAQIVSEYKKEHPNTTLSSSKIVQNYQNKSTGKSSTASAAKTSTKTSSTPKLTLTPEKINAGTNFLAQATKSYATVSQINRENSKSSSKAKKGQKAVDDYTKELLMKGA